MRILLIFEIRKYSLKSNNLLLRKKWLKLLKITFFFFSIYREGILRLIAKI